MCEYSSFSFVPRLKEEEKKPGFSCLHMRPHVDQWEGANDAFKVTWSIA